MREKFGPREPETAFVQDLDTPYGKAWDKDAIRDFKKYLKSIPAHVIGEGVDLKFAAAIDQSLDEYLSDRGATQALMGLKRGERFRDGLQVQMDSIRNGNISSLFPWLTPDDMYRILRRAQDIVKGNEG